MSKAAEERYEEILVDVLSRSERIELLIERIKDCVDNGVPFEKIAELMTQNSSNNSTYTVEDIYTFMKLKYDSL